MRGLEVRPGVHGVFYLAGEFDLVSENLFKQTLPLSLDRDCDVVLDLTDLTFMDATGVRCLQWLRRQRHVRTIVLMHPSRTVRRLLELTEVNRQPGIHMFQIP
jgi:anti-anti-sigma factor